MTFIEWFDIKNPEHVAAYRNLHENGVWPAEFIPKGMVMDPGWQISIISKMAWQYLKTFQQTKQIQHFKGGLYEQIGVATAASHIAQDEQAVVYRNSADGRFFVREKRNFDSVVDRPEYKGPRFKELP